MTIREEGNVSTDSSRLILQQYPLIRVIVEKQREETHGLLQRRLHIEAIRNQLNLTRRGTGLVRSPSILFVLTCFMSN